MNNINQCDNCSKLRQQLTLLIYEVLNLENTMESKICEYVQRRLSEIAISEQLTSSKINSFMNNNDNMKATMQIDLPTTSNENIGTYRIILIIEIMLNWYFRFIIK